MSCFQKIFRKKRTYLVPLHLLGILLTLSFPNYVFTQNPTEYKPIDYSKDSIPLNEKTFKQSLQIEGISDLSKKAKDELLDIYYERQRSLLYDIQHHEFIVDTTFENYLAFVFNQILSSNNLKNENFKLRISRIPIANATCDGSGNITFYIGLLKKMTTEAELAFILCHEISHQLLAHVDKKIISNLRLQYSKENKKELKEISKTEFGAGQKYVDYLKKVTYDSKRHNRDQEAGADSLGLELMLNTRYNALEALRAMQLLDSLDTDSFVVNYAKFFDSKEYPFQRSWVEAVKSLGFGGKDAFDTNIDSIKTHPDCKKRYAVLKRILEQKGYNPTKVNNFIQSKELLASITRASKFEEIQYLYDFKRYGILPYYALNLIAEYSDDAMPYIRVSEALAKMTQAMKTHTLHDFAPKPSPENSEFENQLLRLLDRVSIEDLKNINSNFVNLFKEKFYSSNENFKTIYKQNSLLTKY